MIKTIVKIEGMMCHNCEAHMVKAFEESFKLKKASASHENAQAELISENELDADKLRETVEAAGYKYVSTKSEPYVKKGISLFGK